jgi:CBS domain-containing protein
MKARELMTQPVVTVGPETSLAEVGRIMIERRIGCVPVVDEHGRLCGIITDADFAANERGLSFASLLVPQVFSDAMPPEAVERVRREAEMTAAKEIMTTRVITAAEETPAEEVARQMLRHNIDHVPVVMEGGPVGLVSRHDLLRMIIGETKPC